MITTQGNAKLNSTKVHFPLYPKLYPSKRNANKRNQNCQKAIKAREKQRAGI